MTRLVNALNADIDSISNRQHKTQAKVALALVAALAVGTELNALVRYTGYPRRFVAEVTMRMDQAGLWSDCSINSDTWFDASENLKSIFWCHVLVGAGEARVEISEAGGCTFIPFEH